MFTITTAATAPMIEYPLILASGVTRPAAEVELKIETTQNWKVRVIPAAEILEVLTMPWEQIARMFFHGLETPPFVLTFRGSTNIWDAVVDGKLRLMEFWYNKDAEILEKWRGIPVLRESIGDCLSPFREFEEDLQAKRDMMDMWIECVGIAKTVILDGLNERKSLDVVLEETNFVCNCPLQFCTCPPKWWK